MDKNRKIGMALSLGSVIVSAFGALVAKGVIPGGSPLFYASVSLGAVLLLNSFAFLPAGSTEAKDTNVALRTTLVGSMLLLMLLSALFLVSEIWK